MTRDDKHWPEANWREAYRHGGQHRITDKTSWGAFHEARAKRLAEGFDYVDVLLAAPRRREVARVLAGAKICRIG